jgi:hypothetical protein
MFPRPDEWLFSTPRRELQDRLRLEEKSHAPQKQDASLRMDQLAAEMKRSNASVPSASIHPVSR